MRIVTLDIGANDVDSCASAPGIDVACAQAGFGRASAALPGIPAK